MPTHVRDTLTKLIRIFIWGKNVTPRLDAPQMKRETGGIELPNLKNRNEAIKLVWLREYLRAKPARPMCVTFEWNTLLDLS